MVVAIGLSCPFLPLRVFVKCPSIRKMDGRGAAHRNCFLRGVIGSVAHVLRKCRCFVLGSKLGDPEGMTRRQAGDAADQVWEARVER
jgi:hypothetical protein